MSDRWVGIYLLLCLLQLPLYFSFGRAPLEYDFRMDRVEEQLLNQDLSEEDLAALLEELQSAEALLGEAHIQDSRWARIWLNQALVTWHLRDFSQSEAYFLKALEGFEAAHGPDSFYVGGVNCRYGEFLLQGGRYGEALSRFQLGLPGVLRALGPDDPFTLRVQFRKVAALVQFGRLGEAQEIAEQNWSALVAQAGLYDASFLQWTGQALDTLTRVQRLQAPPGAQSWLQFLEEARQQGRGVEEAKRTAGP